MREQVRGWVRKAVRSHKRSQHCMLLLVFIGDDLPFAH